MMSRDEAAKYFVVAWVKEWPLRTYLDLVAGGRADWDQAHAMLPWMPKNIGWFVQNIRVRRYAAVAMPRVSDRLWDAKDNAARLALAPVIAKLDCGDAKPSSNAASREMRAARREFGVTSFSNKLSIGQMRRGNGHAWAVVK